MKVGEVDEGISSSPHEETASVQPVRREILGVSVRL